MEIKNLFCKILKKIGGKTMSEKITILVADDNNDFTATL